MTRTVTGNGKDGGHPSGRVTCPRCRSRLEIFETPSGGRTVSVAGIGSSLEPKALERFLGPDEGPDIICPACNLQLDPASPYRGERGPRR
jgi:uncharacterized protein YbaR (Trm112 family)